MTDTKKLQFMPAGLIDLSPVKRLIAIYGSSTQIAEPFGISPSSVRNWRDKPPSDMYWHELVIMGQGWVAHEEFNQGVPGHEAFTAADEAKRALNNNDIPEILRKVSDLELLKVITGPAYKATLRVQGLLGGDRMLAHSTLTRIRTEGKGSEVIIDRLKRHLGPYYSAVGGARLKVQ